MRGVHFTDEPPPVDGYGVVELDGGEIADRDDLMEALANALGLPEWFGRNWDALSDVLHDPELRGEAATLVVSDATALWREHPRMAGTLVEVWLDAAPEGMQLVFCW
ncbi:MAG: barstar family protein [Actinomycetota bacterium]|nr:barstar family protein [Actinomycetota bacterium]